MTAETLSWGRYPRTSSQCHVWLRERNSELAKSSGSCLPYGLGRSYGDSCLNADGILLMTRGLDRLMGFDPKTGVIRCEAGMSFAEIIEFSMPRGYFLPVTPGTKFVTVGGAIANDVHGKNHHAAGTFGHHVLQFELLRSDGSRRICSRNENADWFYSTLGGMGLTGLITWAEFQLIPVAGPWIEQEVIRYRGLSEFLEISEASENSYDYTVAWIDCLAKGASLGRGHFIRGKHSKIPTMQRPAPAVKKSLLSVPFELPVSPLNGLTVRGFNELYYRRQLSREKHSLVHYDPFFYPLDSIGQWNRIYGRSGFVQYQCVIPNSREGRAALEKILTHTSSEGLGSFLAVIKIFGSIPSHGMMSFPRPGVTLAMDFKLGDPGLFQVLNRFDAAVMEAGGAIYPAKDARMSPEVFQASFPRMQEFTNFIDPQFSSSFWRRVIPT